MTPYRGRTPRLWARGEVYLVSAFGRRWMWPRVAHRARRRALRFSWDFSRDGCGSWTAIVCHMHLDGCPSTDNHA